MSEPLTEPPALSMRTHHAAPLMSSRRVRLRHLIDRDSAFLYRLMTSQSSGGRVRFGGATPSPGKVSESIWESVLAQFMVESVTSGEPLGLAAITSPNFRDGFAYVSALGSDETHGTGLVVEGVLLAFNYAFLTWPFRKLYMEASEESYGRFSSGLGRFFVEEGRLKEHTFWNGRFMDVAIFAIYRSTWADHWPDIERRLRIS